MAIDCLKTCISCYKLIFNNRANCKHTPKTDNYRSQPHVIDLVCKRCREMIYQFLIFKMD